MYRFLYFLGLIILPVTISWWLFVPLALLLVYLAKLPYEIILAALVLDSFYYFGEGLLAKNMLVIFSLVLIGAALFLENRIHWQKKI